MFPSYNYSELRFSLSVFFFCVCFSYSVELQITLSNYVVSYLGCVRWDLFWGIPAKALALRLMSKMASYEPFRERILIHIKTLTQTFWSSFFPLQKVSIVRVLWKKGGKVLSLISATPPSLPSPLHSGIGVHKNFARPMWYIQVPITCHLPTSPPTTWSLSGITTRNFLFGW